MCNAPNEPLRISGKNLGALAMPGVCERCLWIKLRMRHRFPYAVFPGIFSSIDAFTKNIVHAHFDRHGGAPTWLGSLDPLAGYIDPPHWSVFQYHDQTHDIILTGAADGIFRLADGTLVIVDYKTARYTAGQDALLPTYVVQLNVYRRIAESIGLGTVSALALIYAEPVTDATEYTDSQIADGLALRFTPRIVPIDLQPDLIPPLLQRVRALVDQTEAPPGRPGCKDCSLLARLTGHLSLQ